MLNEKHIGSNFDDFLKEENIEINLQDRFLFKIVFKNKTSGKIEIKEFNLFDELKNKTNYISCFTSEIWQDYEIIAIAQCLGKKDKDGNLIFEGDIASYKIGSNKNVGIVKYSTNHTMYFKGYQALSTYMASTQIIGNIFKNPELLEV